MQVFSSAVDLSYAGSTMDYGRVRAAGYSIVLRYLGSDSRCLTVAERDRIYAAGLRLGFIGQRGAVDRPRGGYPAGREDGAFFEQWADRMGVPAHKPILCAIADVGNGFPTTADLPAIDRYLQGLWETISRPVGIYGPYWVLEHFRGDPRVFCFWQTAGGSGSGQGTGGQIHNQGDGSWRRLSDLACMYQEYGSVLVPSTDHNVVLVPHHQDFTYHPSDAPPAPAPSPEEEYHMKAVFCPDQTGEAGWRPLLVNGRRYREGYGSMADVDTDRATGVIDGDVTLRGAAAQRFLDRYPDLPATPYTGPRLVTCAPDTTWARDVAGLGEGETGRFYVVPNGYAIRVVSDAQWVLDRALGIPDGGQLPEPLFYNQPLLPWAVGPVDVEVVRQAIEAAMANAGPGLNPEELASAIVRAAGAALSGQS